MTTYTGGATAVKRSNVASEILTPALRNRVNTSANRDESTKDSKFANIKTNTFFSAVFDPNVSPESKVEAVGKALTFEGTKEEMRARVEEFETFIA